MIASLETVWTLDPLTLALAAGALYAQGCVSCCRRCCCVWLPAAGCAGWSRGCCACASRSGSGSPRSAGFFKTAQGKPPDTDWWTHKPESFDVAHSDGLFFIDEHGRLRIAVLGMPNLHGRLAAPLRRLLGDKGLGNLAHPEVPWTVPQALDDLSFLLGRRVPQPR